MQLLPLLARHAHVHHVHAPRHPAALQRALRPAAPQQQQQLVVHLMRVRVRARVGVRVRVRVGVRVRVRVRVRARGVVHRAAEVLPVPAVLEVRQVQHAHQPPPLLLEAGQDEQLLRPLLRLRAACGAVRLVLRLRAQPPLPHAAQPRAEDHVQQPLLAQHARDLHERLARLAPPRGERLGLGRAPALQRELLLLGRRRRRAAEVVLLEEHPSRGDAVLGAQPLEVGPRGRGRQRDTTRLEERAQLRRRHVPVRDRRARRLALRLRRRAVALGGREDVRLGGGGGGERGARELLGEELVQLGRLRGLAQQLLLELLGACRALGQPRDALHLAPPQVLAPPLLQRVRAAVAGLGRGQRLQL